MVDEAELSPESAAAEVERVQARTRAGSRTIAWLWLLLAVVQFGFFVGTASATTWVRDLGSLLPIIAGIAGLMVAARRHVVGRYSARIERPVAWSFAGAVLIATFVTMFVLPRDEFTMWSVLLGVLVAVPCLVGAWRIWRHRA